jgi:predicted outer membrane repeat protein
MSIVRSRRLILFSLSLALTFVALASIYSITLARRSASIIVINPGQSIQAAIDAANPGDTIVINAGIYTEGLSLSKAVSLTGVSSAMAIIRAPSGGHVIAVNGSNVNQTVVISGLLITGGSSNYGGGMYVTDNAQPLIQNVTFTGNSASSDGWGGGGGLYSSSSLTLTGVGFIDNSADNGGGLYLGGDVTIILTDCQFINNFGGGIASEVDVIPAAANRVIAFNTDFLSNTTYTGYSVAGLRISGEALVTEGRFENNVGGGLRAEQMIVSGTTFISNSARLGGAILGGDVLVTNSYFERNTANGEGGAIRAYRSLYLTDTTAISNTGVDFGGAVYVEQNQGTASINGGQFINNRVNSGNLYGLGGAVYSFYDISVVATDFVSNTAKRGGGLYARGAAVVENSRFERNRSTSTLFSGGGGMTAAGALILTGTEFISNAAIHDGGGLYYYAAGDTRIVNALFANNTTTSDGAALFFYSTDGRVDLLHTTIAGDRLNPKQAIFAQNGSIGITNTIIANYAIGIERWSGATVTEDYNLFYGNTKNLSGTIDSGNHHPAGSPNFVDPAHNNYHLGFGSAAIDTGANVGLAADLDGNPRPVRLGYDIGAYEYQYAGPIYYVNLPLIRK